VIVFSFCRKTNVIGDVNPARGSPSAHVSSPVHVPVTSIVGNSAQATAEPRTPTRSNTTAEAFVFVTVLTPLLLVYRWMTL